MFDRLNWLQQDIGAAGQTTRYAYDANGNPTSVTDPLNRVTTQVFDALNRLVRATDPGNGVTQYAYNGQDRITQVTDPRNLATTYTVSGKERGSGLVPCVRLCLAVRCEEYLSLRR